MNDALVYTLAGLAIIVMILLFAYIKRGVEEDQRRLDTFHRRLHRSKHEKWRERQCKVCKRWHASPEAASLCSDWDRVGM